MFILRTVYHPWNRVASEGISLGRTENFECPTESFAMRMFARGVSEYPAVEQMVIDRTGKVLAHHKP